MDEELKSVVGEAYQTEQPICRRGMAYNKKSEVLMHLAL